MGIFFPLSPAPQVLRFYFALSFFILPAAPGALVHHAATVQRCATAELQPPPRLHCQSNNGLAAGFQFPQRGWSWFVRRRKVFPHTSSPRPNPYRGRGVECGEEELQVRRSVDV